MTSSAAEPADMANPPGTSGALGAEVAEVVQLLGRRFPSGSPTDAMVRNQGFHWSTSQWRKRWPAHLAMPKQLHEDAPARPYVTRQDVFDRAQDVKNEADAVELFLLMAAWGTGTKARSIARVATVLHQSEAPARLLSAHRAVREGDPVDAYHRLFSWTHDRIKHLGPAFFTKWLYFSAYDSWSALNCPAPLILDSRVAIALGWPSTNWPATRFADYLALTKDIRDVWAPDEPTHVIEYALFQS